MTTKQFSADFGVPVRTVISGSREKGEDALSTGEPGSPNTEATLRRQADVPLVDEWGRRLQARSGRDCMLLEHAARDTQS